MSMTAVDAVSSTPVLSSLAIYSSRSGVEGKSYSTIKSYNNECVGFDINPNTYRAPG